ncbi:MAG: carbon-nitrogen hydrolase [Colwellia sp.]|nr:carbon-nitrogen hydrolase [Colwellia sp.]
MRVAVSQFATSSNVQENLATCLRMINEIAVCKPSLIVLPEYCNTQPRYVDHNQAWHEALTLDGVFLQNIAEQAKTHDCYIVINVTLRRDLSRDFSDNEQSGSIKSNISVTSCLFSPLGELIHQEDKQSLMADENDFFISASKAAEVITTPFGQLGLLTGCDSMTFEASRKLSLSGAHLLCNPLHTFALDQSNLHGPARACENKVFLASANKIGSLVSPEKDAINSVQSSMTENLDVGIGVGVGQSQIVSPEGKVLAKITNNDEGFVFADIDLTGAGIAANNKFRPDGTELIKQLRPELYQKRILPIQKASDLEHNSNIPETANVAIFATYKTNEAAIEDVCHYIVNNLSDIIQLPELFFIADKTITNSAEQLAQIEHLSKQLIKQVSAELRPFQYVCTSLVINGMHQAVLISEQGLFAIQGQIHFCERYRWTELADDIKIIELPLEQGNINIAMLTADDANIPEIVKVAALNNTQLLLVPFDIQQAYEVEYGLISRAAENRICIVAASREKSFAADSLSDSTNNNNANKNKVKTLKSTGLIINSTTKSALLVPLKSGKFTGYINQPLVKYQHGKITKALVHPIAASNKLMVNNHLPTKYN